MQDALASGRFTYNQEAKYSPYFFQSLKKSFHNEYICAKSSYKLILALDSQEPANKIAYNPVDPAEPLDMRTGRGGELTMEYRKSAMRDGIELACKKHGHVIALVGKGHYDLHNLLSSNPSNKVLGYRLTDQYEEKLNLISSVGIKVINTSQKNFLDIIRLDLNENYNLTYSELYI